MDAAAIVERNNNLMSAPVDDEIVFLNPATDNYVALDAIGRRVWELLESPRRVADLVDDLAVEFHGRREEIAVDVQAFLDELESEGMVNVTYGPAS